MVIVAIEASPVESKPPATIGERISMDGWETGLRRRIAVLDQNVFPTRESERFGHHAETSRDLRFALNTLCSTAISVLRLNCFGGALRSLASLNVWGARASMTRRGCRASCSRRMNVCMVTH